MSVKDPIEDLFRDNQHGLDEQPRGLIWDKIEEKLEEKTIVPKKNNGWKYAAAACLVVGLSFASYLFLYDSNLPAQQNHEAEIVHQPMEINEENASEILDKIEEQKQSIVTTDKPFDAPEIYKVKELKPEAIPTPKADIYYDMAPAASMDYGTPVMKETEGEMYSAKQEKMADESIVFRGETPEKKGKNVITSKSEDSRRMGNMAESTITYDTIYSKKIIQQLPLKLSNKTILYDLIENTDDSVVFYNANISFPQKIIFKKKEGTVIVEYLGNSKRKGSKESTEIQSYINKNKNAIYNAGFESGIQIE
ncbi:hypothetical protein [Moheibacter sediminis]|uniref:Uncharacterized protein n=1 Tax=Moheibacter sediminis TaxID=1434700 RepID=A0A1W1YED0_9FLAO|nr:hypothetical protein [Moheibacter sediminis]SMC34570.1 hypothetical protein SAMN06296427_101299 [Moheibacter sediminis]